MTSTPSSNGGDPEASRRAIEDLMLTYALRLDRGDFGGVAALFSEGTLTATVQSATGAEAIEATFRALVITYDDGTPRTKHVTSNLLVDVDEAAGTASPWAYWTLLQALPQLPLQTISAGRYRDRFVRRDGEWRFAERRLIFDMVGDMSHHVRAEITPDTAEDLAGLA